jgi:nitrite reductase/ring-hydroxylating ferredoxin subunit
MLSATDNELLTRTGPSTPMGTFFRRFWLPVLLARELPEPDGPPVRVRILSEDLVAFRATDGRVGLIDPRCSHRGADLFLGRNEDCGLRCVYHGWKFDVDGACVDAPTVAQGDQNERFLQRAAITAYPARQWGDLIWAYLGPPELEPPLPHFEFALLDATQRHVDKKYQDANWAQLCEGGIDTAHFSFLHMPVDVDRAVIATGAGGAGTDAVRWMKGDPQPRYSVRESEGGLVLGGCRRADGDDAYWRIAQFLLPCHGFAPSTLVGRTYTGQTWVPIDDERCWVFCYSWNPDRALEDSERGFHPGVPSVYSEVDEKFIPLRNRSNDYLIDRGRQKHSTFSGIEGISEQDSAAQESQGRIADRSRELLGPTDLGVVRFRRLLLGAARALQDGHEPAAASRPSAYHVRSGAIVTAAAKPFEDVLLERFASLDGAVPSPPADRAVAAVD